MATIAALGPEAAEGSDFPRMGEKGDSLRRTPQPFASHIARVASSFAYAKVDLLAGICVHMCGYSWKRQTEKWDASKEDHR